MIDAVEYSDFLHGRSCYNVIVYNINLGEFKPYNIFPYLVEEYRKLENPPTTFTGIKDFILKEARYRWWSKCEYEIILTSWPNKDIEEKWDVYKQIEMNIDTITNLLMGYVIYELCQDEIESLIDYYINSMNK